MLLSYLLNIYVCVCVTFCKCLYTCKMFIVYLSCPNSLDKGLSLLIFDEFIFLFIIIMFRSFLYSTKKAEWPQNKEEPTFDEI